VSEREGEAQKSKPTLAEAETEKQSKSASASTATAQPAGQKAKKSKLRPRKAPITITPTAVSHLRELLEQPESKLVRVGVKNRGCSGLAYHLEYVDKPGTFDESVQQDGVQVLIDSKALFSIIGSEMDWLEDKLSARFIFKNPNISEFLAPPSQSPFANFSLKQPNNVVAVNLSAFRNDQAPRSMFLYHCVIHIPRPAALHCKWRLHYSSTRRLVSPPCANRTHLLLFHHDFPRSEDARLEVYNPHILNNALQARHELQMRRVFFKAV
jgi:iron-sulfur cluster assembly accessory protein